MNNSCNYIIYWKCIDILIFLKLLEIAKDFHIYFTFIYAVSTLFTFILHLHYYIHLFISSRWAIIFGFAKSIVHGCPVIFNELFFFCITNMWWYCRCRLFKSGNDAIHWKTIIPDRSQIHGAPNFSFKQLNCKSTSQ